MGDKPILNVKNLTVELGGKTVLKDISFSVRHKEVLSVIGPNGAGKTTLLRALLGLLPSEGQIQWSPKISKSYLPPQEFFHRKDLPPMTVGDFFSFKDASSDAIRSTLNEVGLARRHLNRGFVHLSTGQFQRMLVAWSLVEEPDVLLLDEPISGIDIGGRETIYSLLHELWKSRDLTIIMITHDLHVVRQHSKHVLAINKKEIFRGAVEKVLTDSNLRKLYGHGFTSFIKEHE